MKKYQFVRKIRIGNKMVGAHAPVLIIAEAGVNHNGDINIAMRLIDEAAKAGVDVVKFQSFKPDALILKDVEKAPYQKGTTGIQENQYEMLQRLQMPIEKMKILKEYCEDKGMIFLSTPFDEESLEELDKIGVTAYKVASTDTTNLHFLRQVALKGKPIFLSTGMCNQLEVDRAVDEIYSYNKQLFLMQCTANYPVKDSEINLSVLNEYKTRYQCIIGFSDHSEGVGAAPYAVPLGAKVIEKHFTLDKSMNGPDHKASLNPSELRELVKMIRKVETYMGDEKGKHLTLSEIETRKSLQKNIVAGRDIKEGEIYSEENIVCKRTGGVGIRAENFYKLIGKKADRSYKKNDIIQKD